MGKSKEAVIPGASREGLAYARLAFRILPQRSYKETTTLT